MAVPVIAEVLETPDSVFTTQTLTTSAATAAGDTLIIWYASDSYTFAGMPNVTSSAGTCSLITSISLGDNVGHQKAFICPVGTSGAKTITIPAHVDCDIHGVVWRISGTVTVDVFATQSDPANTSASHVAAGVTTTGADRLLGCCWLTPSGPAFTGEPYAPPASMTKRGETGASPFSAMMAASESRPTAGATGTRTATWVDLRKYSAITIALAGAAGGGIAVTGRSAAAATSQATVRKVAAVTAITSLANCGTAVARKAAPASARATAAATSTGTGRKAAPAVARTALAGMSLAAARKLAPAVGVTSLAGVPLSSAAKRAPATGLSAAVMWSYRSQVITRPVTAFCGVAVAGRVTSRKLAAASGVTSAAASADAAARHLAKVTASSEIAATASIQARHVAAVTGRGVLALAGLAGARKAAPIAGHSYAAVTTSWTVQQAAPTRGTLAAGYRQAPDAILAERTATELAGAERRGSSMGADPRQGSGLGAG